MMSAADVLDVVSRLSAADVSFWLDGGWGVDALLEEETRPHDDLDVVVSLDQADIVVECLGKLGFRMELDSRPTRLVLADQSDRRIDLHPIVFEPDGNARQIGAGHNGRDAIYPADGFTGEGRVAGHPVPCLTPTLLVLHHTGYEPRSNDRHNVGRLCGRFGIPLPKAYVTLD